MTIEELTALKQQKAEELAQSRTRVADSFRQIVTPVRHTATGVRGVFRYVSTGIMVYDGIMTGIKLIRRFRRGFR